MAGYGVRAFLVAQSLNQIDRAYGFNHSILDNCHVRIAFAPNDERTARRLSEALGTATELRARKNISGSRLSAWLPHVSMAEEETPRPLLTPGEVLQLPSKEALVMVSGTPPIRAGSSSTTTTTTSSPAACRRPSLPVSALRDLAGPVRRRLVGPDPRAPPAAGEGVGPAPESSGVRDDTPPRTREVPLRRRKKEKGDRPLADLPLFGWRQTDPESDAWCTRGRRARAGDDISGGAALMAKKKYTLYLPVPLARKFDEVARERHGAKSALFEEALRAEPRAAAARRASRRGSRAGSTRCTRRWRGRAAIRTWPPRPWRCSCATS